MWELSIRLKSIFLLLFIFQTWNVNLFSQVRINEIMASAASSGTGNNSDWIELYNSSGSNFDLSGYFLSDNPGKKNIWQFKSGSVITANGYLLVYADGTNSMLHASFKLSKEGETLYLFNRLLKLADTFSYPFQLTDISYGRKVDEPEVSGYFKLPTPGAINDLEIANCLSPSPAYSIRGGFYSGPQSVELSASNQNTVIYYTLDGKEPSENSSAYTKPILINETAVLRVKCFETGCLPGLSNTQSYFINEPVNLPILSLATDPDNFFSDETGIYVIGTAGVAGFCTSVPHNVNQDWERPVNIEFFEKDGTVGLNQLAGVKIFGGCSRTRYPIKSLAFYARKKYETSSFKYQLFPDKPIKEFESFILRASADDQPYTLFRDELAHMLVKDVMNIDIMDYRPVVLYINGSYWGIHNLREKISEHYISENYGVNSDSVELLERNPEDPWNVINGDASHYNAMINYLKSNDITDPSNYGYIGTQMDIDEYINYQITQIFLGGQDWPGNNIKFWRSKEKPYDRWRWILCDLDFTFTEFFGNIMDVATKVDCGCTWPNPPWSTYLFRRLLDNKTFRQTFIQRFFMFAGSHFSRDRIHSYIDNLHATIAPEIPRHIERWGGQKTSLPDNTWVTPIFSSVEKWEENVQKLRDFTDARQEMAEKQLLDYFGISGLAGFSATVEPASQGSIMNGNVALTKTKLSTQMHAGEQIELSCKPAPGYVFSHWEVSGSNENDSILIKRGDSWKYMEAWDITDYNWKNLNYDDSYWKSGKAELGYGDGDEATVIGYGGDSLNRMITAWFRKKITIDDTSFFNRYSLHLLRDDGARLYVNGLEVIRDNLDRWWTGGYSPATQDISGAEETIFYTYFINPKLFHKGENVIAVEIHQSSSTSSDLSFNMDLTGTYLSGNTNQTYNNNILPLTVNNDKSVTAYLRADSSSVNSIYINEVMAKNSTGITDEYGEYEDWVELYNGGSSPVNLAGLYLSDNLLVQQSWAIPQGNPAKTTIPPKGYILFTADNEPSEGFLHAGFKLDKDGDAVYLFKMVGQEMIVIDSMKFGAQRDNISWGRYPDGSANFQFLTLSTPKATNYWNPVSINSITVPRGTDKLTVYPVPTDGHLYVKFNDPINESGNTVWISIYSTTGRLISSTLYKNSGLIELSMDSQPPGMYLLKIISDSEVFERKIIVY